MLIKSAKQRKTEKIYKSYEHISEDYDIMNDMMSFGIHRIWKLRTAEEIKRKGCHRILDVCCGTGDMALLLAAQNPNAAVTAVDFSEGMLNQARKRQKKKNLINLEFIRKNVEHLPFRNGYFDCAVISFGLRSVADYGSVLREMYRVVRPGGWIYCLDSSVPETKEVKAAYNVYRNHMIPAASAVLNGNGWEYKRIAKANSSFLSKKKLAALLMKCGFIHVGYYSHMAGVAACHRGQKPEI